MSRGPVRCVAQRDLDQHDRGERGSQRYIAALPHEAQKLVPHRDTRYGIGIPDSISRKSDPPTWNLALESERG